ncbi:MAG: HlyC/CorC family transporter [Clostridia bacterium]|nr:HlyC/CorC family transporter [Clostridia bacterium]
MNSSIWGQLLLQLILIGLNAVFACAEIAVLSVSEAKLAKLEESGSKKAKKLRKLTEEPSKFLSTIQVAITLSGFLGSAFAADNFAERLVDWLLAKGMTMDPETLESIAVVVITLILSYVTLILGELVPKRLAMKHSEKLAVGMAPMLYGVAKLFTPIVWLLSISTNGVLRLMGIDPNEQDEEVSEEEIRMMVDEGGQKGVIDEQEQEMIQNVFEFDDLTVSEFATHRTDIHILWAEEADDVWENTIHETRHSIYPVCEDTIDNVIGVLSVKDYFRCRELGREAIMKEAVKPAYFVPEGIHADVLFRQMKDTRNHFAVVLDEYGGMMGIVTMYDILEQLVGDLNDGDEEEIKEPDIMQTSDDTWDIKGVASLSEVAEELNVELPTEKYDTMGGYVFSNYGVVPEDGTEFELELDGLHVRVTEIKDHRIIKMIVTVLPQEEEEEDDEPRFFKSRTDRDDEDDEDEKNEKSEKSDKSEKKSSKNR